MTNWTNKCLADISDSCLGKMLDKKKNKGEYKPYLANLNVQWGEFKLGALQEMRFEEHEQDRYGLKYGDLIICEGGEPGRCAIWRDELPNMKVQKALHRLRVHCDYNSDFLYYRMKLAGQNRELDRHFIGSTIKHLTGVGLKGVAFEFPPLKEQQKIAKVLRTLDEKIELNNNTNAELEAMAKLIYDYWFVQFDFPDANGKPYKSSGGKMVYNKELKREIPDGWTVDIINNVINVKDGTHDSPKPKDSGYPLITSKHLKPHGLDFENTYFISEEDYVGVNKRSKVDTGDILFSMIGSIGEIYKVDEKNINFAIKNVALYKSSGKPEHINYIYMFLKSYDMQRYMGNVISGSIQKFIGLGALRNMPIFTNDDIIMQFVKTTEHLFQKKTLIKLENQELTKLRNWLLPMLMNGQVTVKEA